MNHKVLLQEMDSLIAAGVNLDNLWISTRAQMVMPYHRMLDELEEAARGKDTIGTTCPSDRNASAGPSAGISPARIASARSAANSPRPLPKSTLCSLSAD